MAGPGPGQVRLGGQEVQRGGRRQENLKETRRRRRPLTTGASEMAAAPSRAVRGGSGGGLGGRRTFRLQERTPHAVSPGTSRGGTPEPQSPSRESPGGRIRFQKAKAKGSLR